MLGREDGQAVVEYAVIAAFISVVAVIILAAIGGAAGEMLTAVLDAF
jgi:Flp pilus assembly pilin Flp